MLKYLSYERHIKTKKAFTIPKKVNLEANRSKMPKMTKYKNNIIYKSILKGVLSVCMKNEGSFVKHTDENLKMILR
jgi:hypothetical protein